MGSRENGGGELKTVSIDSHNDVVSRTEEQSNKAVAMRERRIMQLWLSEKAGKQGSGWKG